MGLFRHDAARLDACPVVGDRVFPGRYTQQCAVALGRGTDPGDDLHPEVVFVGKIFLAAVRFRATDGKKRNPVDPAVKKNERDFLRVCELLGLEHP